MIYEYVAVGLAALLYLFVVWLMGPDPTVQLYMDAAGEDDDDA